MSTSLIPVFNGDLDGRSQQLCDARDLHQFLQVGRDFSNWIKGRIEQYGFVEGEDFSPVLAKSTGGRPGLEYHLTLDMAKELAMVENNEKGRQVRRYFIAMEREARESRGATYLSVGQQLAIHRQVPKLLGLLKTETERAHELNMIEFMLWTGPRVSEAMALAWEDVDLEAGTVAFRRARVRSQYKVTKTRRSTRRVALLAPALRALRAQARLTQHLPPVEIEYTDRDNRTKRKQKVRFVFLNSASGEPYSTSDTLRNGWWKSHLKKAGVRQRGPNQCRHTFASQMLSSGIAPPEWIADQMGHTSTAMIFKHYAKWISKDGPEYPSLINQALNLS